MTSKTKTLAKHAKRRAYERYDVELNRGDLASMVAQIQKGSAIFLERQSNRVTKWLVKLPRYGSTVPVVYDKLRKSIVTILPADAYPFSEEKAGE